MSRPGLLAVAGLILASTVLSAVAGAQARCGYDACSLRVDGKRIVRGRSGELVLRLGPYTDVARGVDWLSDSARAYASMYRAGRSTAANLRWVALAGQVASTVLGYQVYSKYQRQADEVSAQQAAGGPVTARMDLQKTKLFTSGALSVAALVARWSAARIDNTARGRLAHAVWWHNREIRGE